MPSTNLSALQTLDPEFLSGVVCKSTQHADLKVTDFTVEVLSDKGVTSRDGLFLLQGHASSGATTQSWALVLKILSKPATEQDPGDLWYWKREYEAYHSGLLTTLAGGLRTPHVYALTARGEQVWMWMEHIQETTGGVWTLDEYAHAARQLGQLNGASLTGPPLPDTPWLLRDLARQWSAMLGPGPAWEHPVVQAAFPAELRARVLRCWEERDLFLSALQALPQVFSHFDFHRRNLLMCDEEVVALDWAWCGIGPVGGDLMSLVGSTCMLGEWKVSRIEQLEEAVFEAYVQGLRDVGWGDDARLARLGYTAWMPLQFGVVTPTLAGFWASEERQTQAAQLFGGTPGELATRWAALCEFSLERAEEARTLWPAVRK